MNKPSWPVLPGATGFLCDAEIVQAMKDGQLITDGVLERAKYACYELVIGDRVEQLTTPSADGSGDLYVGKDLSHDTLVLNPGETFKVYAAEKLNMPANVFALSVPVGIMYKLGLNPETTFADPGFQAPFFVTLCNYSSRVVKLKVGEPLARLFFCRLADRPERIHEGSPREIRRSIERVSRPSAGDLETIREEELLRSVMENVDPPHYQHAYVTNRLVGHHRREVDTELAELARRLAIVTIAVAVVGIPSLCVVAIAISAFIKSAWPSLWDSIITAALTAVGSFLLGVFLKPVRGAILDAIATLRPRTKHR